MGVQTAVVLSGDAVALLPDAQVLVDVGPFDEAVAHDREKAIELYAGDLLPDDLYEPRAVAERDRLRMRYLGLLRATGRWAELRAAEPLDEEAHLRVVRVLGSRRHPGDSPERDRVVAGIRAALVRCSTTGFTLRVPACPWTRRLPSSSRTRRVFSLRSCPGRPHGKADPARSVPIPGVTAGPLDLFEDRFDHLSMSARLWPLDPARPVLDQLRARVAAIETAGSRACQRCPGLVALRTGGSSPST